MSEIGDKAKEIAREKILSLCKRVRLTPQRTLKRISESLDAKEHKVFYDKDRGRCVIGPTMIDWAARAKAIDQAIAILDIKPAEKIDLTINEDLADRIRKARERRKVDKPVDK